jgi:hypothetical protein
LAGTIFGPNAKRPDSAEAGYKVQPDRPGKPASANPAIARPQAGSPIVRYIAKAAQQLVQDRLLLEEDTKLFIPNVN